MSFLIDLLVCLRFFSRFPLPVLDVENGRSSRRLADAAAAAPLAGALLSIVGAAVLGVARAGALPATLAAALAVAALVATTGALHEDALADCADGFGGGATRERKLAIMHDSRIGTFGACALILSLYARVEALAAIATHSGWLAATALVAAASLSRCACLLPLMLLQPARAEGIGAAAGRPSPAGITLGFILAIGLSLATYAFGASPIRILTAVLAAAAAGLAVSALARQQVGGVTGDVAGAAQQVAEIAVLLVFAQA
jgi:adenosylcobinamide-GDP ribazoletransferase